MNKYHINEIVMLKKNLILVQIVKIKNQKYCVYYPHLEDPQNFWVNENELEEKPFNYEQKIFEAYLEYRTKYEKLIDRLYSPNFRERY